MAQLSKRSLYAKVLDALKGTGHETELLPSSSAHPLRFRMRRDGAARTVRLYIWNISHGGGSARPKDEYRIQITSGVTEFQRERGETTVILGWSDRFGVFAAWDVDRHDQPLGSSPSMQVPAQTLSTAATNGIAGHKKGNGEVVVAVRPDHLAEYIRRRDAAHVGDFSDFTRSSQEPLEEDFVGLIKTAGAPNLGTPEEISQRTNVLQRLEALEQEIRELKPRLGMMGHNQPPEPLEPDPQVLLDELLEAELSIKAAMAETIPDLNRVAENTSRLQKGAKFIEQARQGASSVVKQTIEHARTKVAEYLVAGAGAVILLFAERILSALGAAITAVSEWLHLIF